MKCCHREGRTADPSAALGMTKGGVVDNGESQLL
jgi:hypothetical protein